LCEASLLIHRGMRFCLQVLSDVLLFHEPCLCRSDDSSHPELATSFSILSLVSSLYCIALISMVGSFGVCTVCYNNVEYTAFWLVLLFAGKYTMWPQNSKLLHFNHIFTKF